MTRGEREEEVKTKLKQDVEWSESRRWNEVKAGSGTKKKEEVGWSGES